MAHLKIGSSEDFSEQQVRAGGWWHVSHMGQDDVELSRAKQVGEKLWFNRLLHELSIEPHLVHEAVQRTGPDAILD
eukprot:COSAG01_NODE_2349_length_7856_cov_4.852520_10_plen_75_part_01